MRKNEANVKAEVSGTFTTKECKTYFKKKRRKEHRFFIANSPCFVLKKQKQMRWLYFIPRGMSAYYDELLDTGIGIRVSIFN